MSRAGSDWNDTEDLLARAKVLVVGRAAMPQGLRTNGKLGLTTLPGDALGSANPLKTGPGWISFVKYPSRQPTENPRRVTRSNSFSSVPDQPPATFHPLPPRPRELKPN